MYVCYDFIAGNSDENESGGCGQALIYLSWILIGLTMPFSLFVCFKVKSIEVPPRGLQMIEKKMNIDVRIVAILSCPTLFIIKNGEESI